MPAESRASLEGLETHMTAPAGREGKRPRTIQLGITISILSAVLAALLAGPGLAAVVAAHRGEAGVHEDTLRSIGFAAAREAAFVETDVRATANRARFVMLHDSTLDRTTNCRGYVSKWSSSRLARRCRTDGGDRVPALSTYLDRVAATPRIGLLLELKEGLAKWQIEMILRRVQARSLRPRTRVMTFHLSEFLAARQAAPSMQVWLIASGLDDPDLEPALVAGANGVNVRWQALVADPSAVSTLHDRGVVVAAWTPDASAAWAPLVSSGVDVIVTNLPGRLRSYLLRPTSF